MLPGEIIRGLFTIAEGQGGVPVEFTCFLHHLDEISVTFTDPAIKEITSHYTKEAGVRSLEREIASVFRCR